MIEKFVRIEDNSPVYVFIDEGHDIGAIVFDGSVNFVCNYITEETFAGALELAEAIGIGRKFMEDNFHVLAISEYAGVSDGYEIYVFVRCGKGII